MANPLLFGGATAAKRHSDGRNYHGNDWEATRYFSNYAELKSPVTYGGVAFPSVEQAYVAAKFNDPAVSQFIAGIGPGIDKYGNASMPAQAARNLGQSWAKPAHWAGAGWQGEMPVLRSDWNDMKVDVMRDLVRQKFENNPEFREFLLSTGDRQLIEHTTGWGDRVWGMVDPLANRKGVDAQVERLEGENHLGKLLMETRASYRPTPEQPAAVVNPTGQQVPAAEVQQDPRRKAGDLLPWLLAAGGTGLAAYALAEELNRGNPGAQVPAPPVM